MLVLAANTAFADFPRLASILARDGYMPRQFAARGDRLAFSNGIIALAVVAALLVWLFSGDTSALIPLYAMGVFVCFTLSQAGMVVHWIKAERARLAAARRAQRRRCGGHGDWCRSIQVATKFTRRRVDRRADHPADHPVLRSIHRHYEHFARGVAYTGRRPILLHHTVIVPVHGITKAVAGALVYATTISDDVRAVCVDVDPSLDQCSRAAGRSGTSTSR